MNNHPLLQLTAVILFCFIGCSKQTNYNYPEISDVCVTKSIIESNHNYSVVRLVLADFCVLDNA